MGKKNIIKTVKGVGNLPYPEVHGVPMVKDDVFGEKLIHADIQGELEQLVVPRL